MDFIQENTPFDTSHSDDRQQNNESAGSSSGLSSGASGSHDINPAFDSESQDEVITQSDPPLYSKEKIMYFFSETRPLSRHFLKKVFFASKKFQTVVRMSKFSKSNNRRKMAVYWDPPAPPFSLLNTTLRSVTFCRWYTFFNEIFHVFFSSETRLLHYKLRFLLFFKFIFKHGLNQLQRKKFSPLGTF